MDENQHNEETKTAICNYIEDGMYKKDASVMAGISEATLYRWLETDESFKSRVEASVLRYKHTLIKNINTCAVKDGRLSLEVLKRRFPKEWDGISNVDEKLEYEGSTRQVADLLQKIFQEGEKERTGVTD